MAKLITWNRSTDGYVTSHCGRWRIVPKYWGRVQPQQFELEFDHRLVAYAQTQRDCKRLAQAIADKKAEE